MSKKEYKLHFTKEVKKFISSLPKDEQNKVLDALYKIKKNPKIGKKIKNSKIRYVDIE